MPAPKNANVAPRPAARFACRLACASLYSSANPFSATTISLRFWVVLPSRLRVAT